MKISLKEVSILESGRILFSAFNSYDTSMILSGYFCTGSKDEKLYFEYICDYYYYYFSSPHVSELTLFFIYHNSLIIDINKSKIRPFCSFCNDIVLKGLLLHRKNMTYNIRDKILIFRCKIVNMRSKSFIENESLIIPLVDVKIF